MTELSWLRAFCAAVGLAAAAGTYTAMKTEVTVEVPEPVRLSLKTGAARAARVPAIASETLPLAQVPKAQVPKSVPPKAAPVGESPGANHPPQAVPTEVPPLLPAEAVPVIASAPALDFRQPEMGPAQALNDPLPPPPKPPVDTFVSQYSDAPGGRVVVIALLVNDRGEVVDAKLVIPSKNALQDVALMVASRQQLITAMQPPLVPGEVRWLEVRLEYPEPHSPQGIVP